jgi:hypothetical protein
MRATNAQEVLTAAAVSATSTPDLALEESAEGAASEEDVAARVTLEPASSNATICTPPSIVLRATNPVSVEPLHVTLAAVTAQLSQSLAALNAFADAKVHISKYLTAIDCMKAAIDYLDHRIAVDLVESEFQRDAALMKDL